MKKAVVPALVAATVLLSLVLAACATTGAAYGVSPAQKHLAQMLPLGSDRMVQRGGRHLVRLEGNLDHRRKVDG